MNHISSMEKSKAEPEPAFGETSAFEGQILVYGPDPDDPERKGGVASHVRYLRMFGDKYDVPQSFCSVDVFSPGGHRWWRPFKLSLGVLWNALRILLSGAAGKTLVVHVNTSLYSSTIFRDIPFIAAAKARGCRLFVQVHGGRLANLENTPLSRWLWRRVFSWAHGLGIHAGPQWDEFCGEGLEHKMFQMLNMVPTSGKKADLDPPEIHFLYLGRVVREKGVHMVLDCFIRLQREGITNTALTIAGAGSSLELLTKCIEEADVKGVRLPGFISGEALQKLLDSSTVFLLPSSHQEGFPFSFLECAERGMVCIVSENSAIPEVFAKGEEFLAVDASDVEDLYEKMKRVALDVPLRQRLGSRVRAAVKRRCTIEAGGAQFMTIYCQLLGM